MEAMWFCIVTGMLAVYALLDGFDLGAGAILLFVARAEDERRSAMAAVGGFWDGNEVWLLLAGGALYCAFPAVYLAGGFYPLAIALLCLLILRGIGTHFRTRTESTQGKRILDTLFGISSLLLGVGLGSAAGCVIRGVPPTGGSRILNWFPVLCGVFALGVLTMQSAAWMALKSSGELQRRCRNLASRVWWGVLFCYGACTAASFLVQPHLFDRLQTNSWISVCAVVALAGLMGTRLCLNVGFDLGAFASASCLIAGLLACTAAGQFPYLLGNVTAYNAGSAHLHMGSGIVWWAPAFLLAAGYRVKAAFNARPQPMMSAGH